MASHQAPPSLGFSRQEHWSGLPFPSPVHETEKWKWSRWVMSNSSQPHGLQPTRLLHPWDFPGKSTGVGCHCLLRVIQHGWLNGELQQRLEIQRFCFSVRSFLIRLRHFGIFCSKNHPDKSERKQHHIPWESRQCPEDPGSHWGVDSSMCHFCKEENGAAGSCYYCWKVPA